uniref:Uncharacterized protein n=1 Tax=Magallana gigas TaxID=29159 RepID=K1R0J0_MAGGI
MLGVLLTPLYVEGHLGSVLTQSKGENWIDRIYPAGRRDGRFINKRALTDFALCHRWNYWNDPCCSNTHKWVVSF